MSLGRPRRRSDHAPDPDAPDVEEADFDSGVLGVEAEDDPGYFGKHHWVNYHPTLLPVQKDLYDKLAAMVNTMRRRNDGDTDVWPSLELLASMVGLSRGDKVLPHLDALEAAKCVVKRRRWFNGLTQRNVYAVRFNPPPGYDGPITMRQVMDHYKPLAEKMREDDKARKAAQRANRTARKKQAENGEKDDGTT